MNSNVLKIILLSCILFLVSCSGVTFKRKTHDAAVKQGDIIEYNKSTKSLSSENNKPTNSGGLFSEQDSQIITSYYIDKANSIIRRDMITHTKVSKEQESKLVINENIPRDIQVMPLPLLLEKNLSPLPLDMLRVQVGTYVILMNVKSRRILAIIKI